MTRDDAKDKFEIYVEVEQYSKFDLSVFIDKIYDDFESRVCKNCKYVGYRKTDNESYCILNNTTYRDPVKEFFGCNKFIREQK